MSYHPADINIMMGQQHQQPEPAPMSRTHQYRKVMKPLLERKRRARINKCLDEIKDILVESMQMEGESVTKLEKADVLELTLKHLQKLKAQQRLVPKPAPARSQADIAQNFSQGYKACVNQVSQFLTSQGGSTPGVHHFGASLMHHLGDNLKSLETRNDTIAQPLTVIVPQPRAAQPVQQTLLKPAMVHESPRSQIIQSSPLSISSSDCGYSSGRDSVSPALSDLQSTSSQPLDLATKSVWRPF